MKKIIIELSDTQHAQMMEHIARGHQLNLENETFSGFGLNLNTSEMGDWLEVDFYGALDVGSVNWKIE